MVQNHLVRDTTNVMSIQMELENENDNGVKTVRLFRDTITGFWETRAI